MHSSDNLALFLAIAALVVSIFAAVQATRSANAAKKSNVLTQAELDRELNRKVVELAYKIAPSWERLSSDTQARFRITDGVLHGALRNSGLRGADVELAVIDLPSGDRRRMETGRELDDGIEWTAAPHIPPGGVLQLRIDLTDVAFSGAARPSIYMDFAAYGLAQPEHGVTVELLRCTEDDDDKQVGFEVGRVRPGLLA